MKRCIRCGCELEYGDIFCPECGAIINKGPEVAIDKDKKYNPIVNPPQKHMNKKKTITITAIVAAALIIAYVLCFITLPRDLVINQGNNVDINVGDKIELTVSGEKFDPANYDDIVWESSDDSVVKVDYGTLCAYYDKDSFNSRDSEYYENGEDEDTYLATVTCELKDGPFTWEGEVNVLVSLEPVEFESGEIIKAPYGSEDSYIEITPSDSYSSYFYFKSTTDESNDMAFLIKNGEFTTVDIPCDTYDVYVASGETWYGEEALFGSETEYEKMENKYEFTYGTYWWLKLDAPLDDLEGDTIDSKSLEYDEFPE